LQLRRRQRLARRPCRSSRSRIRRVQAIRSWRPPSAVACWPHALAALTFAAVAVDSKETKIYRKYKYDDTNSTKQFPFSSVDLFLVMLIIYITVIVMLTLLNQEI